MSFTVAITSQNQIYIPSEIRRMFPENLYKYANVSPVGKSILVTPVPDLLSIGGSLKTDKKYTIKEEKDAFADYFSGINK